jgi:hypothetical protein
MTTGFDSESMLQRACGELVYELSKDSRWRLHTSRGCAPCSSVFVCVGPACPFRSRPHELSEKECPVVSLLLRCREQVECLRRRHDRECAFGLTRIQLRERLTATQARRHEPSERATRRTLTDREPCYSMLLASAHAGSHVSVSVCVDLRRCSGSHFGDLLQYDRFDERRSILAPE